MKCSKALRYAQKVLAIRQQVVADHLRQRNESIVGFAQAREVVNRQRLAIAQHRLGVIETMARAQQLAPRKPVNSVQRIEDEGRRALAQLEARAAVRAEVGNRLRAEAAQAAMDRAAFIQQVHDELPEELWDEAIQEFDRRVYETGGDGGS